jgi:hypothetical protein
MTKYNYRFYLNCLLSVLFMLVANLALADPPNRVARISYIRGAVSFVPAGETTWISAKLNRPLTTGSHLWADQASKAELQIGAAAVRIGQNTSITLLNLDDETAQFQLAQGVINLRVWRLRSKQVYEIDTPNLAFSVKKPGSYRLEVNGDGTVTIVSIVKGEGLVYGEKSGFEVAEGQSCSFSGINLAKYQCGMIVAADDFDQWIAKRDQRAEQARSTRYVSHDIIGYEDLDDHGDWRYLEGYGNVWMPNDVPPGWAPYSVGHWSWIDPWGWTWIDDAPWGFAPFHYGRWVYSEDHWYWVPGPAREEPVYAPALVVFMGDGFAGGSMGWFPLAYDEVYIPPYEVSRRYFGYVNRSNIHAMPRYLDNIFTHRNLGFNYHNQHVVNAITAVPEGVFQKSQSVAKNKIIIIPSMLSNVKVAPIAKVVPNRFSVLGLKQQTRIKPPNAVIARSAVVKTLPPAPPVPFTIMQKKLATNPGKPLTPAEVKTLTPTLVVPSPKIKVITSPTKPIMPIIPGKPSLHPAVLPTTETKLKPVSPGELKPFIPPKPIIPPPHHHVTPDVTPIMPPPHHHVTPDVTPITPPPHHHVTPDVTPITPPPHHHVTPDVTPITPPPHHHVTPDVTPITPPPHHHVTPDVTPITPPPHHHVTPDVTPIMPPPHHHVTPDVTPIMPPPHHHVTPDVTPIMPPEHHVAPPRPVEPIRPPEHHVAPPPPPPSVVHPITPPAHPQVVPAAPSKVVPKEVNSEKDKKEER